eukprot:Phypoly_transcript_17865.p1 GENE.Phypoly_transcript_17865~~Phypoly_transcript_17865.p1  ORF type:complete len:179 (+),score=13.07 Phypoly_transcript_17865:60-596(+)
MAAPSFELLRNAGEDDGEEQQQRGIRRLIVKYGLVDFFSTPSGWMMFWLFLVIVAAGGALTLVMLFHVGHNQDFVVELSSQILNAIFTLMAVSNHPLRLWDLYNFMKGPIPKNTHNLRKRYLIEYKTNSYELFICFDNHHIPVVLFKKHTLLEIIHSFVFLAIELFCSVPNGFCDVGI